MGRLGTVAVATLLLLAGAATMAAPASASLIGRGPISITSDAGFTAANGVTGGSGTPADPYVISGWHIVVTSGAAIKVTGVTKSFLITGNLLESTSVFSTGMVVQDTQGTVTISNNEVLYQGAAIALQRADAEVTGNTLLAQRTSATGISVLNSQTDIHHNRIDEGGAAILLRALAPQVHDNIVTAASVGVTAEDVDGALVHANTFDRVDTGVSVGQAVITVSGNDFIAGDVGVRATGTANLTVTGNEMDGQQVDAVVATDSTVDVAGNTITNTLRFGIHLTRSTGRVDANTVMRTGGAISLAGASVVHVTGNAMTDNHYGLSIPYAARQSIPHLSGNVVNGVSVDDVYHWREANVQVSGGTYTAAFTTGGYGGLTAQGAFVFYDVDTAKVEGVTVLHGRAGVTAEGSFNVQVVNSTIVNVDCGVRFNDTVGFVKNTTIIIDVDPPATCGVDVHGGFVGIFGNTIANFEVGIRLDARARGDVALNNVTGASAGLWLEGTLTQKHDAVVAYGNNLSGNIRGAVLVGFRGTLQENNISANAWYGVELALQANPILIENEISGNVHGVVDAYACVTIAYQTCSGVHLEGNVIANNSGIGVLVNGSAYLEGNVIVDNGVGADLRGGATLRVNVIARNDGDGARVRVTLDARGDVIVENGEAGLRLTGLLFTVIEANVSANFHGIVVTEVLVEVPPVEPPSAPVVTIPRIIIPDVPPDRDPLFVHLTALTGNRGDAIRASPYTLVNATYNYWGGGRPCVNVGDVVGAFQNCVTAGLVLFTPWWQDREMTRTGPVRGV